MVRGTWSVRRATAGDPTTKLRVIVADNAVVSAFPF
jgi:hypothetical protein